MSDRDDAVCTEIERLRGLLRRGVDLWDGCDGANLTAEVWCEEVELVLDPPRGQKEGTV